MVDVIEGIIGISIFVAMWVCLLAGVFFILRYLVQELWAKLKRKKA